jgi:UDP-GlcNAc:undecaprenyl-phosphate GlcNAc-1-phosphate transferase
VDGAAAGLDVSAHLLLMGALLVFAVATSLYLVYVLEIVKLRRVRAWQLRRTDPDTSEHEIVERVERELETGEFRSLTP